MLKRATVFFAMLCAGAIAAVPTPGFPTELKQSLDLSDSQISRILSVNRDYTDLANNKSRRTYDLYREISEESAKNLVNPLELGKTYAEQEAIRRELGEALALAYSDFVYRKRVEQIQLEIRDETAKDPLDPMELGIRYAEFQAFCEYLMDPSSFGADDRGYSPYRFPSCEYR